MSRSVRSAVGFVVACLAVACAAPTPDRLTNGGGGGDYTSGPSGSGPASEDDGDGVKGPTGGPFCEGDRVASVSTAPASPTASIEEQRAYALVSLNALRAVTGLAPLKRDACLDRLAQAAVQEFAASGQPHTYFTSQCLRTSGGQSCECGWAQENQGGGTAANWKEALHSPLCAMMAEPEGQGHRANIQSRAFTRVGIGIGQRGAMRVFSHEFGR
jgi:uncharacterized protein YkwD